MFSFAQGRRHSMGEQRQQLVASTPRPLNPRTSGTLKFPLGFGIFVYIRARGTRSATGLPFLHTRLRSLSNLTRPPPASSSSSSSHPPWEHRLYLALTPGAHRRSPGPPAQLQPPRLAVIR